MGILKISIIFLLGFGCTKYPELEKNVYGNYFFKTDQLHIKGLELIPWKVGISTSEIITKGILLTLTFPQIKNDDLFAINEKTKANAWIIRVRRSSTLGSSILGYYYAPFFVPGKLKLQRLRAKQISSITMQIMYAAANLSLEIGDSPCPPLKHRKLIKEIYVDPKPVTPVILTAAQDMSSNLTEEISPYSYQTSVVNGGMDLIGTYHFEIAFFDSANKKILGDWVEYPQTFTVVRETELDIPECNDYEQPKMKPDFHDYKRFKWKKNTLKEKSD